MKFLDKKILHLFINTKFFKNKSKITVLFHTSEVSVYRITSSFESIDGSECEIILY